MVSMAEKDLCSSTWEEQNGDDCMGWLGRRAEYSLRESTPVGTGSTYVVLHIAPRGTDMMLRAGGLKKPHRLGTGMQAQIGAWVLPMQPRWWTDWPLASTWESADN